jgi:hypothetical protein
MVLEEALEQGVEVGVVLDAVDIVVLGHPLDHQDDQRDGERVVAKHLGADRVGRADHRAGRSEAAREQRVEQPEQVDVLGLLAGEVEQSADPVIVLVELRAGMVEHERQNELFDHTEQGQIFVAADLVEDSRLRLVEERNHGGPGERLGHERLRIIERAALGQHVLDLPGGARRGGEHVLEIEIVVHFDVSLNLVPSRQAVAA